MKIGIIGGGIIGSTAAYYLSQSNHQVTLIDSGIGQATSASAGIICPWFSQRRNQDWYQLVADGATFYRQLMQDLSNDGVTQLPFEETGVIVFKRSRQLAEKLLQMGIERKEATETIGELYLISPEQASQIIPGFETTQFGMYASGGGRVDGAALVQTLQQEVLQNNGKVIRGQARLLSLEPHPTLEVNEETFGFDQLILAPGAWLGHLLEPFGIQVDIRPQKGELITTTIDADSSQWPVTMLVGESDLIPTSNGELIIGASHENDKGFDLTPTTEILEQFLTQGQQFLPSYHIEHATNRIGTRAYTSDFLPF